MHVPMTREERVSSQTVDASPMPLCEVERLLDERGDIELPSSNRLGDGGERPTKGRLPLVD